MTGVADIADVARFRAAIVRRLGLRFDDAKVGFLAEVLQRRLDAAGPLQSNLIERLETQHSSSADWREIAREITVGETYFFRHAEQFHAFRDVALPACIDARAESRQLRLLSAGCASGEEAYTLAILVRERALAPNWSVSIRGVDINPVAIEKATLACYSPWSLRETPVDVQSRWFVSDGRSFALEPSIRAAAAFDERNLLGEEADLWLPAYYDVVFCRNVMMYLAPQGAQRLVARIADSLVPGGYLFLGHAETLRGLSHDFHLRHTNGTFYYQRKGARDRPAPDAQPVEALPNQSNVTVPAADWATTWIATIQRASARIRALSEESPSSQSERSAKRPAARPRPELGIALELLKLERFGEALGLLGGLSAETERDPDLLLLRAVLLTHAGKIDAAEAVCAALLDLDELSAGAHYVLALCREAANDPLAAIDHDRVAVYLDPSFAMPRLHLGLMARRAGDHEAACREIAQAVELLQREDASRLLLFGGGFGRDALVALGRAELAAAGGRS